MQLFGDPMRATGQSWDHVTPADHVLALSVPCGPRGQNFSFTFANRSNAALLDDLGEAVLSIAATVPDVRTLASHSLLAGEAPYT